MKFILLLTLTILGIFASSEAKIKSGGFPWWLYAAAKASTTPDPTDLTGQETAGNPNVGDIYGVPSGGMFLRQVPASSGSGSSGEVSNYPPMPPMPMSPYGYGYPPPMPMFNPFLAWKMQKIYMEQVLNITTTPKPPKLKIKIKGPIPPGSPMANLPIGSYEIDNS